MISVVFSTRKDNQKHIKHIKETSGIYKDLEVIQYINDGEYSLTQLYNKALKETTNDIVVFCHDDIIFETKNWGKKILNHFKRNSDYGILGKAGTKYLPKSGRWWDCGMTEVIGQVYHQSEGKKWLSKYSEYFGNKIEDTIIVDGLFFVVNKNNIKQTFDEDIKGFHFYEVDFCFNNFLNGVKVGVISDISITHLSIGQTNDQWENNRVQFVDKYVDKLPQIIPYTYDIKKVKDKEPLVSILMPIYNYGNRINQTLNSVFNQDYTNYEIILVDDGSTDEFVKMKLKQLETVDRVKVVYKENGGPSSARNEAFKHSKGEFILPLDSDDMVMDGYIKTCVNILSTNKNISPVYCDTHHVGQMQGVEQRPEWSKERLVQGPFIVNCSMFHRESFEKVGGYDEELNGWEDYDMWLRMMKEGYVGKRIPKPLFIYFHHENDGTVSTNANKNSQELYLKIISKNFEIIDNKIVVK
jgi:glycosyltransferase involved in cell wall biosynthesis